MDRNSDKQPHLRLAFVGWGAIARRVVQLISERGSNTILLGVGTRTAPAGQPRCRLTSVG